MQNELPPELHRRSKANNLLDDSMMHILVNELSNHMIDNSSLKPKPSQENGALELSSCVKTSVY